MKTLLFKWHTQDNKGFDVYKGDWLYINIFFLFFPFWLTSWDRKICIFLARLLRIRVGWTAHVMFFIPTMRISLSDLNVPLANYKCMKPKTTLDVRIPLFVGFMFLLQDFIQLICSQVTGRFRCVCW